jgi:hypothetical protein
MTGPPVDTLGENRRRVPYDPELTGGASAHAYIAGGAHPKKESVQLSKCRISRTHRGCLSANRHPAATSPWGVKQGRASHKKSPAATPGNSLCFAVSEQRQLLQISVAALRSRKAINWRVLDDDLKFASGCRVLRLFACCRSVYVCVNEFLSALFSVHHVVLPKSDSPPGCFLSYRPGSWVKGL